MYRRAIPIVLASAFLSGCAAHHKPPTQGTLADLHNVAPDVKEAETKESVDQAMQQYRKFLEESPETPMTPEAIRRLAGPGTREAVRHTHGRQQGAANACSRGR